MSRKSQLLTAGWVHVLCFISSLRRLFPSYCAFSDVSNATLVLLCCSEWLFYSDICVQCIPDICSAPFCCLYAFLGGGEGGGMAIMRMMMIIMSVLLVIDLVLHALVLTEQKDGDQLCIVKKNLFEFLYIYIYICQVLYFSYTRYCIFLMD